MSGHSIAEGSEVGLVDVCTRAAGLPLESLVKRVFAEVVTRTPLS